jgi:hypothetical protein
MADISQNIIEDAEKAGLFNFKDESCWHGSLEDMLEFAKIHEERMCISNKRVYQVKHKDGNWQDVSITKFNALKANPDLPWQFRVLFTQPQQPIPEGWKLVPIEPTEEMLESAVSAWSAMPHYSTRATLNAEYKAMLSAVPNQQ